MHRIHFAAASLAEAAIVVFAFFAVASPAGASELLPKAVSQAPVNWTPNVSAGPVVGKSYCNSTFFGTGSLSCQSEVYDTAFVNGDVVVVGAFTEACEPGPYSKGLCAPGTQVTRDDIFAYSAGTGRIDPHFVPVLDAGPAWSVVPGPGDTVYVGGDFKTVDRQDHSDLVQLNVRPGVTGGATADGSVVPTFDPRVNNEVRDVALSPDHRALYVGGVFTNVDGLSRFADGSDIEGLARLDAVTGTFDNSFAVSVNDPIPGSPDGIEAMALSPAGTQLAVSGGFLEVDGQSRHRLAIVDTGRTLYATAHLSVFVAPILQNNCSSEHDYVRGLAYAPDGSFLVVADTGNLNDGSMSFSACDAVARFDITTVNTRWNPSAVIGVAPSWINYAGGDSFYSVAVAGGVVYAGGHDRWVNNYCGDNDVCEPNAVLVDGLSAIDANTGIALAWWHPQTLRGRGTMYLGTFQANTYDGSRAGLAQGTDVDLVGGSYHSEEALWPIANAASASVRGGPVPSGLFNEEDGADTRSPMCMDDTNNSSSTGNPVELRTCVNDAEQNWRVEPNGTIEIHDLCLDTSGGATASGTPVVVRTCRAGARTQRWTQGPGNSLINVGASAAHPNRICLIDANRSTTNGNPLQIWTCTGTPYQVWPLPAAQAPPPAPATGEVWPEQVESDNQIPCLDDTGDSMAAGNKIQLWTCTGDNEQNWTVETDGTIRIDGNHCLSSASSTQKGEVGVVIDPCRGSPAQLWSTGAGPVYSLINRGASTLNGRPYCLQDPGPGVNGAQVQLTVCAGGNDEAWRLPAV